jgi:hypothetical protein
VRVVAPNRLLAETARILEPIRDEVVVIGALAVQIALDGHNVALTPTLDIDAGAATEGVSQVVTHLEEQGLRRGEEAHERAFTWVKDDVKVQLIRPFHPFPKGVAAKLPTNNLVAELEGNRWLVSFEEEPARGRFWTARPAILVALKEAAFGRTRPDGAPVDRDFSDAALLLDRLGDLVLEEVATAPQMRLRIRRAAERLSEEGTATAAAARELAATGQEESQRVGEATVLRASRRIMRETSDG